VFDVTAAQQRLPTWCLSGCSSAKNDCNHTLLGACTAFNSVNWTVCGLTSCGCLIVVESVLLLLLVVGLLLGLLTGLLQLAHCAH
jgi:hypothetical protein